MATNTTIGPETMNAVLKASETLRPPEAAAGALPPSDEMLTTTELAARLKTTVRTIENWKRKRVVRAIQVEKVVLFYWPSVVARLLEKYQAKEKEVARKGK